MYPHAAARAFSKGGKQCLASKTGLGHYRVEWSLVISIAHYIAFRHDLKIPQAVPFSFKVINLEQIPEIWDDPNLT